MLLRSPEASQILFENTVHALEVHDDPASHVGSSSDQHAIVKWNASSFRDWIEARAEVGFATAAFLGKTSLKKSRGKVKNSRRECEEDLLKRKVRRSASVLSPIKTEASENEPTSETASPSHGQLSLKNGEGSQYHDENAGPHLVAENSRFPRGLWNLETEQIGEMGRCGHMSPQPLSQANLAILDVDCIPPMFTQDHLLEAYLNSTQSLVTLVDPECFNAGIRSQERKSVIA